MKTINDLHEKYVGFKAIILGNGKSINDFKPLPDTITIGVNDINKKIDPDYHLLVDTTTRFSKERILEIYKTNSKSILTQVNKGWDFGIERQYLFKLGSYGAFPNLVFNDKLDFGLDSPYMGVLLAYKMGIRIIGLLGVDYTPGHFYNEEDGDHQLVKVNKLEDVKRLYCVLHAEMTHRRTQLFNLNKTSKIDTVPFMPIETFAGLKP